MTAMERRMVPFMNRHPELADLFEAFPLARTFGPEAHFIRVEEYEDEGHYVVRAELPGIDPDKDVEITLDHGMLTICAERVEEKKDKQRSDFRYGSFTRSVTLPEGTMEGDITASYDNGILTVKAPVGGVASIPRRIEVGRSD